MGECKKMIDTFEILAEEGKGVLAVPPQNEQEHNERDRLMQVYLRQRKSIGDPARNSSLRQFCVTVKNSMTESA
jgi:hypothetical protein